MSVFDNESKDNILIECENMRREGKTVKDIISALMDILSYIVTYWLE